eukprot:COSAG02_NODE_50980_length_317_cov_0.706422_1_plen_37_part_10
MRTWQSNTSQLSSLGIVVRARTSIVRWKKDECPTTTI